MAAERPHACILIPTFENAETLEDVVRRSLATGLRVLVVDDGSAAETREILARLAGETDAESLVLERHEVNRGKGAALATGFRRAGELGFTHVIALDSDGQHFPEDVPLLLENDAQHGLAGRCDRLIFVDVPRDVRAERAARTRGWSEAELLRREEAQLDLDEKRRRADHLIQNQGTESELERAVAQLLTELALPPGTHPGAPSPP